ncbi:putative carboxylesterase [Rosa chinensis]|uniref:Putative carboxylesterase n=1 Tax=Rosa chinensis TaxID=74649 RepID=A0A2P6PXU1_ROSCH|nr:probable carboxylesterase 6 [Rosa chinensis]PRQ26753.1 putative carboxylesterase [Rosa chinensis]
MSLVEESPDFLQVFSDGTVKRFAPGIVPASSEPSNGYKFKDVIIDSSKPITGRVFIPSDPTSLSKLPVVVYFHGGGFCIGSTTWIGYHHFLGDLSVSSQSIVLSIDYRLAPENRLPIAYEDCYDSLVWLGHQASCDPWLNKADLSRVFLSGDSAGGNIAHNVAVKTMRNSLIHVKIRGLLLIHPYFGSEKRTEKEMSTDQEAVGNVASNDMFWRLSIPEGSNRDYFGCSFDKTELSVIQWRNEFPAVTVYVAELDFLKERGVMYAEFLQRKGVEVKLVEAETESHVFHVFKPECEATRLLQKNMKEFIWNY